MTSKPTSNYDRIWELGAAVAKTLHLRRPSDMTDWPRVEVVWHQLELRLKTLHGYDVLSGMQDGDVPGLVRELRARLHYWAVALLVPDYGALLLPGSEALLAKLAGDVATLDKLTLIDKGTHYGDSWKKRGGVGAFMMLARKWDRLDNLLASVGSGQEFVAALRRNPGDVQDDVHDLRRYLLLVEDEAERLGARLEAQALEREQALRNAAGQQ